MRTGRGSYRKCYVVSHGNGFKYLRRVPKDIQPIEKRSAWVKCLGSVSRAEAEMLAHALAYEHAKRMLTLRALAKGEPVLLPINPSHEGQARSTTPAPVTPATSDKAAIDSPQATRPKAAN